MNLTKFAASVCRTSAMMLTLMGAAVGTPLFSQDLTLCLQGRTNLDSDTMKVFAKELTAIAHSSGLALHIMNQTAPCKDIRLSIKSVAKTEISSLSATKVKDGRMLPEIEIYATSIAALMQSNLPALVGRGMARVAAREIGHYLVQTTALLPDPGADYITAPRLLVNDNRSFRIPITAAALNRSPIPH